MNDISSVCFFNSCEAMNTLEMWNMCYCLPCLLQSAGSHVQMVITWSLHAPPMLMPSVLVRLSFLVFFFLVFFLFSSLVLQLELIQYLMFNSQSSLKVISRWNATLRVISPVQLSPLTDLVVRGHEGWFNRDPFPLFSMGGCCKLS